VIAQRVAEKLKKMVGEENFQILDQRIFLSPGETSVVSEIIKLANQEKFKILPLGSGSTLDCSKFPSENMVVLRCNRLNEIKKVVPEDLHVTLQPGFPLRELNSRLKPFNLFYPLADEGLPGTIGGAVATNLTGRSEERTLQTKEYVLAMEVVNPQGQILNIGAKTFKSVTGYDLPRLFVGSWGTIGFIAEISLRLIPLKKRGGYTGIVFHSPRRNENRGERDLKAVLSSRIKNSLDPHGIFFDLYSLP